MTETKTGLWFKEELNILLRNKYIRYLLFYSLLQIGVIWGIEGVGLFPDSPSYERVISQLQDKNQPLEPRTQFLFGSRPLSILFPYLLSHIFSVENAFGIQASLSIILSGPFMFLLSKKLLDDEKLAFMSTLFFISSFPVLYWGFAVLTDMPSYLFFAITTYAIIRLFEKSPSNLDVLLVSILCGIGFLVKQNIVFSLFFFYILLFFNKGRIKTDLQDKITKSGIFIIFYFVPIILVESLLFIYFDSFMIINSLESYVFERHSSQIYSHRTPIYFLQTIFIDFGISIPLFLIGIFSFCKDKIKLKLFSCFMLSTLFPLMANVGYTPRFTFLLFPMIFPIAALGYKELYSYFFGEANFRMEKNIFLIFVIFYFLLNNIALLFSEEIRDFFGFWPKLIKDGI